MKNINYENLLCINTNGEEDWQDSFSHYHPYQATDYKALDILFNNYNIVESDYIVDFGCGKGRLIFYINYFFNATCRGIEMSRELYNRCLENKKSYLKQHKNFKNEINFENVLAQEYKININDNKFYFFNPFSIKIFIKVIDNILESIENNMRYVELILYYPLEDYIYYLENNTPFEIKREILLNDLYIKDKNERFLVFGLSYY